MTEPTKLHLGGELSVLAGQVYAILGDVNDILDKVPEGTADRDRVQECLDGVYAAAALLEDVGQQAIRDGVSELAPHSPLSRFEPVA